MDDQVHQLKTENLFQQTYESDNTPVHRTISLSIYRHPNTVLANPYGNDRGFILEHHTYLYIVVVIKKF